MWPSLPPAKPVPRGPSPDGSDASPPPGQQFPAGAVQRGGRGGEGGDGPVLPLQPSPWALPQPPHTPPREEVVARVPGGDEMLQPPSPLGIASGARARAGGRAGPRAPRSAGGGGGPAAGRGTAGERGGALRALTSRTQAPPREAGRGGRWTEEVFLLEVCVGRCPGDKTPCTPAWWRSGRPPTTARRCAGPNPLPPFTVRTQAPPREAGRGGRWTGEVFLLEVCVGRRGHPPKRVRTVREEFQSAFGEAMAVTGKLEKLQAELETCTEDMERMAAILDEMESPGPRMCRTTGPRRSPLLARRQPGRREGGLGPGEEEGARGHHPAHHGRPTQERWPQGLEGLKVWSEGRLVAMNLLLHRPRLGQSPGPRP